MSLSSRFCHCSAGGARDRWGLCWWGLRHGPTVVAARTFAGHRVGGLRSATGDNVAAITEHGPVFNLVRNAIGAILRGVGFALLLCGAEGEKDNGVVVAE